MVTMRPTSASIDTFTCPMDVTKHLQQSGQEDR